MQGTLRARVSSAERRHDYVVVGHVSRDLLVPAGTEQAGGTAFYSGLQAARLGLRTLIVTAGVPGELDRLLAPWRAEFDVLVQPAAETTSFEASGTGFDRTLRLRSWAGPIATPAEELDTAILHLAPVARETRAFDEAGAGAGFVGITPQGLIRRWGADGEIAHLPLGADELPQRLHALVISATELAACGVAMDAAVERGAIASITAGEGGAEVITPEGVERAPALRVVEPSDDLGAGDVYATAFFAALASGTRPRVAMQRGQAASFHKLSAPGPAAVAGAERIAELAGS
jgi:sugar/nucleoside kinase (ribokinase family)